MRGHLVREHGVPFCVGEEVLFDGDQAVWPAVGQCDTTSNPRLAVTRELRGTREESLLVGRSVDRLLEDECLDELDAGVFHCDVSSWAQEAVFQKVPPIQTKVEVTVDGRRGWSYNDCPPVACSCSRTQSDSSRGVPARGAGALRHEVRGPPDSICGSTVAHPDTVYLYACGMHARASKVQTLFLRTPDRRNAFLSTDLFSKEGRHVDEASGARERRARARQYLVRAGIGSQRR